MYIQVGYLRFMNANDCIVERTATNINSIFTKGVNNILTGV